MDFGKVWYLVHALSSYGIFGSVFLIIKLFLSGIYNNFFIYVQYSEEHLTKVGVTQGSHLSTLQHLCFNSNLSRAFSFICKYICRQCHSSWRNFKKSRWPKHDSWCLPWLSSVVDLYESFDYYKKTVIFHH